MEKNLRKNLLLNNFNEINENEFELETNVIIYSKYLNKLILITDINGDAMYFELNEINDIYEYLEIYMNLDFGFERFEN